MNINQYLIFQPFLSMMLLTMVVWIYMFAKRIPFINGGGIKSEEITAFELMRLSPPAVANPSDNLKNLFELPVLFYGLCMYLFVTFSVDQIAIISAWIFVGFRVLHSFVHCTVNIVMLRFVLYSISALTLWSMILRAAWGIF